jgi:hypothetical protein
MVNSDDNGHSFILGMQVVGNIATVSQIPEIEQAIAKWAEDRIATVSQIPEIEQAIAEWAGGKPPCEKLRKDLRNRLEASFANIRERNVQ